MSSKVPKREELLVTGWIRQRYDIPDELIMLVNLFCRNIIGWNVKGDDFKQLFNIPENENRNTIWKSMIIDGIPFKLRCVCYMQTSWSDDSVKYSLCFYLQVDLARCKDILWIRGVVSAVSNMNIDPNRTEFGFDFIQYKIHGYVQ